MKKILAFGDSNTWGLIPGTSPFKRYPWGVRWTSILDGKSDEIRVIEEGLCGRTTVFEDELRAGRKGVATLPIILESQTPLDYAIIMLGTNDCKSVYNVSAHTIGKGIERCLDIVQKYLPVEKILLISPIDLGEDVWRPEKDPEFGTESVATSKKLKEVYRTIADRRGVNFLAASDYAKSSEIDNEHLDDYSHRIFADAVWQKLTETVLMANAA